MLYECVAMVMSAFSRADSPSSWSCGEGKKVSSTPKVVKNGEQFFYTVCSF